jgi:hypothetical protein
LQADQLLRERSYPIAVRVSLPGPRGKGVILADLPAGELLGEVALLDGKERGYELPVAPGAVS